MPSQNSLADDVEFIRSLRRNIANALKKTRSKDKFDNLSDEEKLNGIKECFCRFFLCFHSKVALHYKSVAQFKECENVSSFYAKLFSVDILAINIILDKLDCYLNEPCGAKVGEISACEKTPIVIEPKLLRVKQDNL